MEVKNISIWGTECSVSLWSMLNLLLVHAMGGKPTTETGHSRGEQEFCLQNHTFAHFSYLVILQDHKISILGQSHIHFFLNGTLDIATLL